MTQTSGVYQIENSATGQVYVGASKNLRKRWKTHITTLRDGCHHSRHLQKAWDANGETAFEFSILIVCAEQDLRFYEQLVMDRFRPEYNVAPLATSVLGVKRSEEYCRAMALRNTGKKLSPETIEKRSAKQRGRKQSVEERAMRSAAMKGKVFSAEHRANLSKARIGTTQSAETVANRVMKNTGKKRTPEQLARMSVAIKEGLRRARERREVLRLGGAPVEAKK